MTELLDTLLQTLDPHEIDGIYRELTLIFQREVPMTGLFPDIETHVAHRRIQGLSTPWRGNPLQHMGDLWIEEHN